MVYDKLLIEKKKLSDNYAENKIIINNQTIYIKKLFTLKKKKSILSKSILSTSFLSGTKGGRLYEQCM